MSTRLGHFGAVLALPFNVLVVIPAVLVWLRGADIAGPGQLRFWLSALCFAAGLSLMAGTIRRFVVEGDGTLAPWDPTQKLVVSGVYRHVRNPMISGVVINLVGETLLLGSAAIGAWAAAFFVLNALYMPLSEEPGLEKRFGEDYRRYRENVPRWLPRRTPWTP
jgi:protein-S-isoprenylcysteine O-methyltransferase Ste14